MLATIPEFVAAKIIAIRPHLETKPLPSSLKIEGSHAELLWPAVTDDDDACKFVRAKIREIARAVKAPTLARARAAGPGAGSRRRVPGVRSPLRRP
jgi:LysR family transcriptional activator of mexEF-oprN operon